MGVLTTSNTFEKIVVSVIFGCKTIGKPKIRILKFIEKPPCMKEDILIGFCVRSYYISFIGAKENKGDFQQFVLRFQPANIVWN